MSMRSREACYGLRSIEILTVIGLVCLAFAKFLEWQTFHRVSMSFLPWSSLSMCSFPAAQIILGWNRRWSTIILLAGACLGAVVAYADPADRLSAVPLCLGYVSVVSLCLAMTTSQRQKSRYVLCAGLLVLICHQLAESGQYLSTAELLSFDNRAYLVDRSMGFDAVGLVLHSLFWLPNSVGVVTVQALHFTYLSILLAMSCTILAHLRIKSPEWIIALTAYLLAGGIGAALYHLFPAAGPHYAFEHFPLLPDVLTLRPDAAPLPPEFIRNCMPSLHTAWALLVVMNARSLGTGARRCVVVFACLTLMSTLALGEHYLIDLVVAVPFAVAVQALARSIVARTWPTLTTWAGGACVAIWLFVLVQRVSWLLTIHGLTLGSVIVTVAGSLLLFRRDCEQRPVQRHQGLQVWQRRSSISVS